MTVTLTDMEELETLSESTGNPGYIEVLTQKTECFIKLLGIKVQDHQ